MLGVILFGSNIMLIAQIYHIDAHYPNGALLWALGGMATAYLMHSQPAMIARPVDRDGDLRIRPEFALALPDPMGLVPSRHP